MNNEENIRKEEEVVNNRAANPIPSGEDTGDLTEDDVIVGGDGEEGEDESE